MKPGVAGDTQGLPAPAAPAGGDRALGECQVQGEWDAGPSCVCPLGAGLAWAIRQTEENELRVCQRCRFGGSEGYTEHPAPPLAVPERGTEGFGVN